MAAFSPVRLTIFGIICFLAAFFMAIRLYNDGKPGWKHIITSDGRGYYAYLPAVFLDRDLSFATTIQRESTLLGYAHYKPGYLVKHGDNVVNKYFAGEALLLLPFFLVGWLLSALTGLPADGYSFFFQVFTGLGALFYLAWGLLFLERILKQVSIPSWAASLSILLIMAGTNLFYYTLWQPTMSHVFSFFAINGFLWYSMRTAHQPGWRDALLSGVFLGVLCLIRPTNGVIILAVPFLAGGDGRLTRTPLGLLFLAALAGIVAIQPLLWYLQTGDFFVWSYQGEGFRFTSPEISNTLFSYRKGLFIYTPALLLIFTGIIATAFRDVRRFISLALFLISALWIVASWWNWYYGDGFGLRAFIDYYGLFAILIAHGIQTLRGLLKGVVWFIALVFIGVNMVQTWQYTHGVIHPNSMNEAKFHHVFMRCDSAAVGSLGGNQELAAFGIDTKQPVLELFNDFSSEKAHWSPVPVVESTVSFSGRHCTLLDSLHPFGKGVELKTGHHIRPHCPVYIEGTLMIRDSSAGASNTVLIVLSMDSIGKGENYWQGFKINDVPGPPAGAWRPVFFSLMLPEITNPDGTLKVYPWQTGTGTVWVDDFRVKFFLPQEERHRIR
jgi:hypothetical protein